MLGFVYYLLVGLVKKLYLLPRNFNFLLQMVIILFPGQTWLKIAAVNRANGIA